MYVLFEPVTIMYMQEAQSARGNVMKELYDPNRK